MIPFVAQLAADTADCGLQFVDGRLDSRDFPAFDGCGVLLVVPLTSPAGYRFFFLPHLPTNGEATPHKGEAKLRISHAHWPSPILMGMNTHTSTPSKLSLPRSSRGCRLSGQTGQTPQERHGPQRTLATRLLSLRRKHKVRICTLHTFHARTT